MNPKKKKLKRKYLLVIIFLSIFFIVAISIASIIEYDPNKNFEGDYILLGLVTFVLPILGSLLFLNGLSLWAVEEKAEIYRESGFIAWSVLLIICILGGPALVFILPVVAITFYPNIIFSIVVGIILILLEFSIAITTILINGGSKAVQSTKFGRKIQKWKNNWQIRLFEKK